MSNCVADTLDVMRHFHIATYSVFIGWSTGAQLALTCLATHPKVATKLLLLNPSTGRTLHTVLQPLIPLPAVLGSLVSRIITWALRSLVPIVRTPLWLTLKSVAESTFFLAVLEVLAFAGGFPYCQPAFFHQYMFDTFSSRAHTMALLNLIVALDEDVPLAGLTLPNETVIVSGAMDFMTGVYHSWALVASLPSVKHVCFTMGSHFVLIEWPALVAEELVALLRTNDHTAINSVRGASKGSKGKAKGKNIRTKSN